MKKKVLNFKGKKLTAKQLQEEILKLFRLHPKKRLNAKQVINKLNIENNKDAVQHALEKLSEEKQVKPIEDDKFSLNNPSSHSTDRKTYTGLVDMTRTGSAYIVCDELKDDIHVSAKRVNGALHGDKVKISVWTPKGRNKPEGEIMEVIERATSHFLGTLRLTRKYGIVIPDKDNMPMDIFVKPEDVKDAKDGDKVVVKVVEWPSRQNHSPIGKITAVLGAVGSSDIEMKSILINNGFELDFPEEVLEEMANLNDHYPIEELEQRRDMRDVPTFTIDPDDAKDFDDALSLRYLENGHYEVGVHIADVSHYVLPGTALDKEAFKRSTSVYLVDRVLPMLPEKISNELCSLRPNEEKLTFSAVFEFDKNDHVVTRWFGKTIIYSNRRFTYKEAQEVLDSGEGDFAADLKKLNQVAKKLRAERFKNGSIDFNADEVRFVLDEQGVPVEVYVKERRDSNMLIEDFMLLANREVATYISKKGESHEIPFVYRVHDQPDADKVAELIRFAREMGVQIHADTPEQIAKAYNKLAKQAITDPTLKILEPLAIRTMAKAEYSANNIGHYGLGFQYYSHFTSPIRRYSDVLAHRILFNNLNGATERVGKEKLEHQCKYISKQERKANEAERESVKYKQTEFMKKHLGEVFEGVVSGLIDRGIFVETLHSKCEGLIGFQTMNEPFDFGRGNLKIKGKHTGKEYKMGDLVKVRIVGADLQKRRIEMELVTED